VIDDKSSMSPSVQKRNANKQKSASFDPALLQVKRNGEREREKERNRERERERERKREKERKSNKEKEMN